VTQRGKNSNRFPDPVLLERIAGTEKRGQFSQLNDVLLVVIFRYEELK